MRIMRAIKMNIEQIKETITIVKDYPIMGIVFKDITTLLEDPEAFKSTVDIMIEKVKHLDFNRVVGVESRGFFWSGPIAYALSKSFAAFVNKTLSCGLLGPEILGTTEFKSNEIVSVNSI